jgi:oligoribonuclease NrnB/cAMP/cGMP phosphodiesterase (DHH superfamily)
MKIFHHDDLDGICSAAIVNSYYNKEDCNFISVNYKHPFPIKLVSKGEKVIIVDFSLKDNKEFNKLLDITKNVVWIDHHKTAIEKFKGIEVPGIRKDGTAGCVLTWKYFYPNKKVPKLVDMLGDHDVWDFSKYAKEDLERLQCGIMLYNTNPESSNWNMWLKDKTLNLLLNQGDIALKYRTAFYRDLVQEYSFRAKFAGYDTVYCNAGLNGSQIFDSLKKDYDIMLTFIFDGEKFNISLYTEKEDIDVSEIAKKHGGGGHKGAAGFNVDSLTEILPSLSKTRKI